MGTTRQVVRLLLALAALAPAGCFGVSQNPSYFPFYLPTGDIIRTHAKPPGHGYFANFDPHACRLEVTPLESSGPTKSQLLIVAAVTDENGQPRRARRVEWIVEGAGNIVEVDESGYFAGRGYKVDNRYAVSYTDYKEHSLRTADGQTVCITPGQTWCVITAAVEGDTHVTVYAPEIANWERHKVFVLRHWCDAEWKFPPATACPAGGQPVLSTQVMRVSDRQPISNYKVRYRVLDGPPTQLLPSRGPEAEVASDGAGQASVTLSEMTARAGSTRLGIEVIRPEPSGPGVVVGRGETTLEWQTSQFALNVTASPTGVVGEALPVTVTVSNPGQAPTQAAVVSMPVPPGVQFVTSEPPAKLENGQIVWQITTVPANGSIPLRALFRVPVSGTLTATASAQTRDGLKAEGQATIRFATPQLRVGFEGPRSASPGDTLNLEVSVANTGTGPATNVKLRAELDPLLIHESKANPLEVVIGTIAPGQSQTMPLTVTAIGPGRPTIRILATGDGALRGEAVQTIAVVPRALQFSITGAPTRYVNRDGTWDVHVVNAGQVALSNVNARVHLPTELGFRSATGGGRFAAGDVVWQVGDLRAGERRELQFTGAPLSAIAQGVLTGSATADRVPEQRADATFEVMGMPVLRAEITPPTEPIPARGKGIVTIRIMNQGTLAARNVTVAAITPAPFLTPMFGTGPTVGRKQNDRIDFAPLDRIEPGQSASFRVELGGNQPGDGRMRVEVKSDSVQTPLTIEEAIPVAVPAPPATLRPVP
jgi:uncharacterized repeat protein (TIGR01451 family)